jgi:hypothetical protein
MGGGLPMTDTPRPVANDPETGDLQDRLVAALAQARPVDARIATAFLTPDGFIALKEPLAPAGTVRVLLGERPFLTHRGPEEPLAQPDAPEDEELVGPSEARRATR